MVDFPTFGSPTIPTLSPMRRAPTAEARPSFRTDRSVCATRCGTDTPVCASLLERHRSVVRDLPAVRGARELDEMDLRRHQLKVAVLVDARGEPLPRHERLLSRRGEPE